MALSAAVVQRLSDVRSADAEGAVLRRHVVDRYSIEATAVRLSAV